MWSSNYLQILCNSAHWSLPSNWSWKILISLMLFHCSLALTSFLHSVYHWNWGPTFNIAVIKSFESWRKILFPVVHEFNICFKYGKCISYEMTTSLILFKSTVFYRITFNFLITMVMPIISGASLYSKKAK